MTSLTVTSGEAIDAKAFWTTLGQRATGMTVVTADSDDGPTGFLGLSAAHVTASPATMLVSVDRKTSALAGIRSRGQCCRRCGCLWRPGRHLRRSPFRPRRMACSVDRRSGVLRRAGRVRL
jgi:hypothetical protein